LTLGNTRGSLYRILRGDDVKPFDSNGLFQANVHEGGIRRLAVRGAGITVLSSGVGLVVQIASTVVLSRLLLPKDFGLVTMVTTFSILLVNFGINGFTEAVLQTEKLNKSLASNLFWINMASGLVLTIVFAASGSAMARFYNNPLVSHVAVGISLSIIATSTSVLPLALLKRAMRFTTASIIGILAQVTQIGLSIILAWMHWGYKALVVGIVAQAVVQALGAWAFCPWIPGMPRRVDGTRSMVQFAMHVYGRFTVNYFSRNSDNLLVGWRFGAGALGFYKKAYDLFALSASQLTAPLANVAVSALSRFKPQSPQYRNALLNALGVIAFAGMGLSAMFTLVGKDLIRILLGPGWEQAGQIFMYFGPGIGVMMVYYAHSWIHLSIGRPDRWFRWGIVEVVVTFSMFLLMLHWGAQGIAVAWTVSFWVLILPGFWYAGKPIAFGVGPVIAATWRFVVAALAAGCITAVLFGGTAFSAPTSVIDAIIRIAKISVLFSALYLGAVIILHKGFAPLYQVVGLLGEMMPGRKAAKKTPTVDLPPGSAEVTT
jgi:polysaccharide transporter, PST family